MQDYNFASGSVYVQNLVSGTKGGMQTENV
jgi:hypothetical protein